MISELFGSMVAKVLSILTILFLSTSLIMTHLYLGARDELASLQSTYTQLKQTAEDSEKSKERVVEGNKQDDGRILEKEIKIQGLNKSLDTAKKALASLPKKTKCTTEGTSSEKIQYVDIDQPFDDDFIRVFKQSSDKNKGSGDISPR